MSARLVKYGLDGKALYDAWERELEDLNDKQRYNPEPVADAQRLRALKQKLHASLQENAQKTAKAKNTFFACVVVAVMGALLYPVLPSAIGPLPFLLGTGAAIYMKAERQKNLDRCHQAILDFDKENFGGEVLYKWKNGISL